MSRWQYSILAGLFLLDLPRPAAAQCELEWSRTFAPRGLLFFTPPPVNSLAFLNDALYIGGHF